MKRETAIRIGLEIADRLKKCNCIIGTHEYDYTAFRIKRMWLLVSTAKGRYCSDVKQQCLTRVSQILSSPKSLLFRRQRHLNPSTLQSQETSVCHGEPLKGYREVQVRISEPFICNT